MSAKYLFFFDTQTIPLVVQTYLYSLCTALTLYILHRRWVGRKSTPPSTFMIWVTLAMFVLFTYRWLTSIYGIWATAYVQSVEAESPTSYDSVALSYDRINNQLSRYGNTPAWALMLMLGDGVSLWRAYAILGRPRILYVMSAFIILAEVVLWIIIIVEQARIEETPLVPEKFAILSDVCIIVPAFAQLLSTLLIAYKTWVHWRDVREFVGPSNTRRSIAILVIVIESGAVYFVILICYVILIMGRPAGSIQPTSLLLEDMYAACIEPLVAMYPTVVIVLVAARLAILESSINSAASRNDLRFAAPPEEPSREDDALRVRPQRRRWLEEDHEEEVPRRLEVSFGPSIGLRSVVIAAKDEGENEMRDSTNETDRGQVAPPSRSEISIATVSVTVAGAS